MEGFLEGVAFGLCLVDDNGRTGKGIQVRGNRLAEDIDRNILDVYGELGVVQFGLKQSIKWGNKMGQDVLRSWMHNRLRNLDFIP